MKRRIAILAALPLELKPLVQGSDEGWKRREAPRQVSLWTRTDEQGDELIAACAGMGAEAARRAFAAAESFGPLDLVLSVGMAGATGAAALPVGSVSAFTEVIDAATGERFSLGGVTERRLRLATTLRTADAREKQRLAQTYAAVMVDMEAATVARLAAMRDLPMGCFKAVSDAADAELPEIDRFVDSAGQLRTVRFALYLTAHPQYWRAVASLARGSRLASLALANALRSFLAHKDWTYTNRTGQFARLPDPEA